MRSRRGPSTWAWSFALSFAVASGALAAVIEREARSGQPGTPAPRARPATTEIRPPADAAPESGPGADASVQAPTRPVAAPLPGTQGTCPDGMAQVDGGYCPAVAQRCLEWDAAGRGRCQHFSRPSRCLARRRHLSFCMDRYEWPNQRDVEPVVMVNWNEAAAACRSVGKRLCREDEWTFACEGPEMLPYPYGFDRQSDACTIDHFARAPRRGRLSSSDRDVALGEARRVYEASPSGTATGCVSPFGVHDLTGNVDEWTSSLTGIPYRSTLQGGWWGRVRTRCRPVTRVHFEYFRYFNIGFRCCANVPPTPR